MTYWDWRDRLATANRQEFWPIEEIDRLLMEGKAQFWCDGKAALVTHVVEYPGGARVLEAIAAAGTKDTLDTEIEPACEAFARANNLTHLSVSGRGGWARLKRKQGWQQHQSTILKELS